MITIEFYNSTRKNAKSMKRYSFQYNNYTELNYIHTVLSYIVEFMPAYYAINSFKIYKLNNKEVVYSTGYRHYKKIDNIEDILNTLIAYACNEKNIIPDDLKNVHESIITRQLIEKYNKKISTI